MVNREKRFKALSTSRYTSVNCECSLTTQDRSWFLNYLFLLNENYVVTVWREEGPQDGLSGSFLAVWQETAAGETAHGLNFPQGLQVLEGNSICKAPVLVCKTILMLTKTSSLCPSYKEMECNESWIYPAHGPKCSYP